ncbi:MAG TPA: alpha-E domain-containing protein [Chitinophagaceae bacterium]|nr:alpha-E domain-containing protein [Chitinophagaceae bacterium]HNU14103.1 alpha-E domain-containing protein [Chitinophagaceae bacterium]
MLSRVADSVFWMARYMERTNGTLRLLRTNYISSQDEVQDFSWQPLLRSYSDASEEEIQAIGNDSPKVLEHLLLDRNNGASVFNNITRARENARAVQDHITKEVWQCLNDYYHLIRDKNIHVQVKQGDPVTALDSLIYHGMLYHGTVDITMARGEGFNYLNIGKFLERAILSADMLNIKLTELNYNLQQPVEVPALRYLLYSLSGYELYLKTHRGNFQADHVLQQVLYNDNFPHSVSYCLKQLFRYFERLESESLPESYKQLEFLIGRAMNNVKYSSIRLSDSEGLRNFLYQTRQELFGIAAAFNQYYFGNS